MRRAGNKFDGRAVDSSMRRRSGVRNPDDNDDRQQRHKSTEKYASAKREIFKGYYSRPDVASAFLIHSYPISDITVERTRRCRTQRPFCRKHPRETREFVPPTYIFITAFLPANLPVSIGALADCLALQKIDKIPVTV